MKIYNIHDLENASITSFHELVRMAHLRSKKNGIPPEDYLIVNLFLEGEAIYQAGDKRFQLKPNYLTITHPGEEHQLQLPEVNQQCTLIYSPQYIKDFVAYLTRTNTFLLDNPEHPFQEELSFQNVLLTEKWDTVSLVKKIYEMIEGVDDNEFAILGNICFQEALLSIVRNEYMYLIKRKKEREQAGGKGVKEEISKRIHKAVDYIGDTYNTDITLDELAKVSTMSKFHFTRSFKQVTGLSPYQYIAKKRVENSKMFLKNSHFSIAEIAYEVGFSNPAAFTKFFTKTEGMSPSLFRKG